MLRIIILLIAVSSDSDIYMLEKGATTSRLDLKTLISHSLIFGCVSALMVLLGVIVGHLIISDQWFKIHEALTILFFFLVSFVIFVKTYQRKEFIEHRGKGFVLKATLHQALLTGFDTLLIGITLSSSIISWWMIVLFAFLLNVCSSISAACVGYYLGADFQKAFGYINSCIYFTLAIYELFHMFI